MPGMDTALSGCAWAGDVPGMDTVLSGGAGTGVLTMCLAWLQC